MTVVVFLVGVLVGAWAALLYQVLTAWETAERREREAERWRVSVAQAAAERAARARGPFVDDKRAAR